MGNKNAPKPSYWPEKSSKSDDYWDHACGCDIISQEETVRDGGVGRTTKTDKWEEKDKEDAYGN